MKVSEDWIKTLISARRVLPILSKATASRVIVRLIICLTVLLGIGQLIDCRRLIAGDASYDRVSGPCNLAFPEAHGPHIGYRTEWWYYTGNLWSEAGKHYGFQLTFFRRQLSPSGTRNDWPNPSSDWRTQQLYLAHAAISDVDNKRFFQSEEIGRGIPGIAGAMRRGGTMDVFLKTWSARITQREHVLKASGDGFSFSMSAKPLKNPVLNGDSGYSLKGKSPQSASCYYSLTRLSTQGSLTINGKTVDVSGIAWMDHEFSSAPLEPDLVGWDWFSLQLDNNTEIMLYFLRTKDGSFSPASSGTFVKADGEKVLLSRGDLHLEVFDRWKSNKSGALYPSRWKLEIKPVGIFLEIEPALADQELETRESTRVTYWEGSVSASGTLGSKPVRGFGYVELTGYAKPFDSPM